MVCSVRLLLPAGSKPLRADWVRALNVGVSAALHNGPLLGERIFHVVVLVVCPGAPSGKILEVQFDENIFGPLKLFSSEFPSQSGFFVVARTGCFLFYRNNALYHR